MLHELVFCREPSFYQQHAHTPKSALGLVTSGGTLANLTALWCARNAAFPPTAGFAGVVVEGMVAALRFYNSQAAVIIGSRLMHYSMDKAADVLGLGAQNCLKLDVDAHGRVDLQHLARTVAACRAENKRIIALVGVAGTTSAGSIDPLHAMAAVAREAQIHFHVDAAWGGGLLFAEEHRRRIEGIALADSVTLDAHKRFYLPVGLGVTLFRDPHLADYIEKHAEYILRARSPDLGKRTLEGSRPGMALLLHAALHLFGRSGYRVLANRSAELTRYMAEALRRGAEWELLMEPELDIVLYRYLPARWRSAGRSGALTVEENHQVNEFNVALHRHQRRCGRTLVSRTLLDGSRSSSGGPIVALRAVLTNPLARPEDVDAVLEDQMQIALELDSAPP